MMISAAARASAAATNGAAARATDEERGALQPLEEHTVREEATEATSPSWLCESDRFMHDSAVVKPVYEVRMRPAYS